MCRITVVGSSITGAAPWRCCRRWWPPSTGAPRSWSTAASCAARTWSRRSRWGPTSSGSVGWNASGWPPPARRAWYARSSCSRTRSGSASVCWAPTAWPRSNARTCTQRFPYARRTRPARSRCSRRGTDGGAADRSSARERLTAMKISGIQSAVLSVPTRKPMALEFAEHRLVVAEIQTDEGVTGLGYSLAFGGGGAEAIQVYLETRLKPLLLGEDPLFVERLWERMYRADRGIKRQGVAAYAVSALDI